MDSGIYSQLNTVGSTIWDLLVQPVTFAAVTEKVLSTYDTTENQCKERNTQFSERPCRTQINYH